MALSLEDLPDVRAEMLSELEDDISNGTLYFSPRLKEGCDAQYRELLRQAIEEHDDEWLGTQIRSRGLLRTHEIRNMKTGPVQAKVPVTAPQTLAEGEFNRFCCRAVCCSSLAAGEEAVEVYRAKAVTDPRPESQQKLGSRVPPRSLLDDLRKNIGIDTALGIPAGPNSGLSVRRIR
ncbi:MAG TPA: hypothetical protein VM537_17385 [Anaerolineae bacterium]|nr:hypothetical protein [Anaerolineae bacterium]